jgi:cell division septation protein DedD
VDSTATEIIETALRLLVGAGLLSWPAAVGLVLLVALLAVLGPKALAGFGAALRSVKVEPSPEPISDGGIAADRELPPAEPTTGEPGGGETGGMG